MRYRLRMLFVLMATVPLVAAVLWMAVAGRKVDPLFYLAASFAAMVGLLQIVSWLIRNAGRIS